jgi:hypothetical protein
MRTLYVLVGSWRGGVAQQEPGEHEGPALSLTKGAPSCFIPPTYWGLCPIVAKACGCVD